MPDYWLTHLFSRPPPPAMITSPFPQGAYRAAVGTSLTPELWCLLWGAAASSEHRARLCAVEWACDLFDFSDVAARRLCVTLCDDKVTAVRSAASRGLHPQSRASTTVPADDNAAIATATATASATKSSTHPKFKSFVLGALRDAVPPGSSSPAPAPASLQELPPAALARALDFALECHRAHHHSSGSDGALSVEDVEGGGEAENEDAIAVFLSLIEDTLMSAPSATDGQHSHTQMVLLHRSAAVALRKLAAGDTGAAPGTVKKFSPVKGVAAKLASRGPWLQQWLGHESSTEIREAFAETTGAAAAFMDPNAELVSLLRALVHKLKVTDANQPSVSSERAVALFLPNLSVQPIQILWQFGCYLCWVLVVYMPHISSVDPLLLLLKLLVCPTLRVQQSRFHSKPCYAYCRGGRGVLLCAPGCFWLTGRVLKSGTPWRKC